MDKKELPNMPEERDPQQPTKKIPRILPTSREEYESRRRYFGSRTEYFPSTFNVDLDEYEDDEDEEEEVLQEVPPPKQKKVQDNPVTIFDFLMMIPIFFTTASFVWHLALQEVHPILHSILDFVIVVYYLVSIIFFASKEKLDDAQILLMVMCAFLEVALLGVYGDMSHVYLQCMFSVLLALSISLVFALTVTGETKRGTFTSIFGRCLWFGAVIFLLWRRIANFRWIGFCQLTGLFLTTLLSALSGSKITKGDACFAILSIVAMLAVIFGFGS